MNEEQIKSESETQTQEQVSVEQSTAPKRRGPGRPPKSGTGHATPARRGRPPKPTNAATNGARRRGRPPNAVSLVVEFERAIETRYQAKLDKTQAQIAELKGELKAAQKRERAALKLFEKQEKALTKFVTSWNSKELAKVQKAAQPRRRRGRPRKNA